MTRPAARPWLVTVESLDWLGDPCFVVTVERRGQTRIQAVDDTAAGALAIALRVTRAARAAQLAWRRKLN